MKEIHSMQISWRRIQSLTNFSVCKRGLNDFYTTIMHKTQMIIPSDLYLLYVTAVLSLEIGFMYN